VYVPPEHRQRGHFKALYAHVKHEAHKAGATGLRLYADTGNARAHSAVRRDARLQGALVGTTLECLAGGLHPAGAC
jgi:hypothetical protein